MDAISPSAEFHQTTLRLCKGLCAAYEKWISRTYGPTPETWARHLRGAERITAEFQRQQREQGEQTS